MNAPDPTLSARLLAIARRDLGVDTDAIAPDSPLAMLGDSLDFVDLLSSIEADFGIDISQERLTDLRTLGDLCTAVQATLDEQASTPRAPT